MSKQWKVLKRVGGRGHTVSVCVRGDSPTLHLRWWGKAKKNWIPRSLGHSDMAAALEAARLVSADLLTLREAEASGQVTLQMIFSRYEVEKTVHKSAKAQTEDARRLSRFAAFFTARDVTDPLAIDSSDLDEYVRERRAEGLRARGIEADLSFLSTVFNWAAGVARHRGDGKRKPGRLIPYNPVHGYAKPREVNPERLVATREHFLETYRVSMRVDRTGRFRALLGLLEALGWRVTALCELRACDLDLRARDSAPYGRILKRAETDKMGVQRWVPLPKRARLELDRLMRRYPCIGRVQLFPQPRGKKGCWQKDYAQKLHRRAQLIVARKHAKAAGQLEEFDAARAAARAEKRLKEFDRDVAGVVGCHAYRRKWATERDHLPRKRVAYAGAWLNPRTLDIYVQPTEADVFEVMEDPRRAAETRAAITSTVTPQGRRNESARPQVATGH